MDVAAFNIILNARIASIRSTLESKASEYANEDRLHNFKFQSAIGRCTPEHALRGNMLKHLTSVLDLIQDIDASRFNRLHLHEEKIGDTVNYLILLEALIKERISNADTTALDRRLDGHRFGPSIKVERPKYAGRSCRRKPK